VVADSSIGLFVNIPPQATLAGRRRMGGGRVGVQHRNGVAGDWRGLRIF